MQDPYARYRAMQVQTAGREQLLLLLFDGIAERLQTAIQGLETGDLEAARPPAWQAQAMVMELLQTLDLERGGELAPGLSRLYTWWSQQILAALLHRDATALRTVLSQVEGQRDAWSQAAARLGVH